jgi:thymidylate synthase
MDNLILPIIHVEAETLPEAWEKAVVETWERGACIATQYDAPSDPPSRDATAIIVIRNPFAEPRIHRGLPGGIDQLEAYRQEVVDGIHNHWINPADGKWEYTYNDRLFNYKVPGLEMPVDQIEQMVSSLSEAPHTRRAQAILWKPWEDMTVVDPPCLQRCWARIFGDTLVMNVHMRSNDAFKAAFMNMFAFTDLQRVIAERVSERLGRPVRAGQYTHVADSFHIYGSYFGEFRSFLDLIRTRPFEKRTYRTEYVQDIFDEAKQNIRKSLEEERRTGRKGL